MSISRKLEPEKTQKTMLVVGLLYAIIGFFVYIQRQGDFKGYLEVGNLVLAGENIYTTKANTWPPFFSVFCVPLALLAKLSPYVARGLWLLLSFLSYVLIMKYIAKIIYDKKFSLYYTPSALNLGAPQLFVPFLCTYSYVISNFEHIQINIILFAIVLYGLYLDITNQTVKGAVAIGFAASLKVMPFIFVPYFIYKRRFKSTAFTTLATAGFSMSPVLVFGWRTYWDYVHTWKSVLCAGWGVGKMNQSLYAMFDRYTGHGMIPILTKGADGVPATGETAVSVVWFITLALIGIAAMVTFRGGYTRLTQAIAVEWSIVFIVSAISSTVCWKAYLVVILLGASVLYYAMHDDNVDKKTKVILRYCCIIAFILGPFHSQAIFGKNLSGRLEMTSLHTLGACVWLLGLFYYRFTLMNNVQDVQLPSLPQRSL